MWWQIRKIQEAILSPFFTFSSAYPDILLRSPGIRKCSENLGRGPRDMEEADQVGRSRRDAWKLENICTNSKNNNNNTRLHPWRAIHELYVPNWKLTEPNWSWLNLTELKKMFCSSHNSTDFCTTPDLICATDGQIISWQSDQKSSRHLHYFRSYSKKFKATHRQNSPKTNT